MKRFVSILCCLAMVLVSIPFSVGATEESIDFTAEFIHLKHVSSDVHNSDSIWSKLRVLDTADECAEFVNNACSDGVDNVSTNMSEYFATVPDSYFDNNVFLACVLTLPNPGYELEVCDISVENRVMTININRWISDPDRDYPDCFDFYAVVIALERSDLNGVSSYNVVTSSVSDGATEKSIDFTAEFITAQHVNSDIHNSDSNWNKLRVLDTADECAEFVDNACTDSMGNVSTNISEYFAAVPDSFFDENVILAYVLTLPNPGYELEVREINVKNRVMTINIDRWISDPDHGYPDCLDFCAVLISVKRSDLNGVDSYNVVTSDTRENLATNVNVTVAYNFPKEYLENAVAADGKGDLFVIDTAAKANEFAALNINEEYNQLDINDYFNSLPDGFFDEKAVLVSVIECGVPNKGFSKAVVTKAYGKLTTEIYYTVESDSYEDVVVNYFTLIEIDKALLNSTTAYDVILRDSTEYESIGYTAQVMNGFISYENMKNYDASDYATINDIDELEGFLEVCDSTDFQEYVNTLADNFFDNNVLVVAPYNAFMGGMEYVFGDIEDIYEGEGTYWRMNITAYTSANGSNAGDKLFVYEIDKDYGNVVFHPYVKFDKLPGIFEYEDIRIGLTSMSYLFLKRHYFKQFQLNEQQQKNADVNKNGKIDPMDYMLIKRCYFGQYTPSY